MKSENQKTTSKTKNQISKAKTLADTRHKEGVAPVVIQEDAAVDQVDAVVGARVATGCRRPSVVQRPPIIFHRPGIIQGY